MNTDTREMIMSAARTRVQARGYNALSFRDLAKDVGVKSASIHYHFPTKGDLAAALARRYTEDGVAYLEDLLATNADPRTCIDGYTNIFRAALVNDNRMCLCGIMAAERADLPTDVRIEIDRFTDANVQWLARVLSLSASDGVALEIESRALAVFSAVEGAQLVARGRGDIDVFDKSITSYRSAGLLP